MDFDTNSPKFNIKLKVLIFINIINLLIIAGLIFVLLLKKNNLYSLKIISTSTPSQFSQTSSLSVDKSIIFDSQKISGKKDVNFKKLVGYIKNIYEKDGKIYLDFDETSECITKSEEVAKVMIEDGKCLPSVTFEEVLERVKGAPFSKLEELCPEQYFGYGVGYCYFRNTSTEIITFQVHPETVVLYNIHPYDFETKERYKGAENYQISLNTFRENYYPKDKFQIFKIKTINDVVFSIAEYFIPRE